MKPIDVNGFEEMFRKDKDPWNYAGSVFEAYKRDKLLKACGDRTYGRGFELACANGETTRRLAGRCLNLLAVDAAPTAVEEARRRTADLTNVELRTAVLPAETPMGPYDLIVASEILYYLPEPEMITLLTQLASAAAPGGRIVVLHHVIPFADAAQPPARAQAEARDLLGATMPIVHDYKERRFAVFAVEKARL